MIDNSGEYLRDINGGVVDIRDYVNGYYKVIFTSNRHRDLYFYGAEVEAPMIIPCPYLRKHHPSKRTISDARTPSDEITLPNQEQGIDDEITPKLRSKREKTTHRPITDLDINNIKTGVKRFKPKIDYNIDNMYTAKK